MGVVFEIIVFLFHLGRKLLRPNRGFKIVALAAVFHGDVEITIVAGGGNARQD